MGGLALKVGGSFAGVALVLGLATLLSKLFRLDVELSRKMVHISLSHWILLAIVLFDGPLGACIAPACFIVINFVSYKKGTFSAIERAEDNSPGTVWYAVSLFALCAVFFAVGKPYIAACGMLAMGWGDGLAALVGIKWGSRKLDGLARGKTLEGAFAALVASGVAIFCVCIVARPEIAVQAAVAGGAATCALELCSPRGIDNLSVPLGSAGVVWMLDALPGWRGVILCAGITLLVATWALLLRALSAPGAAAAMLLGVALYLAGGWWCYGALIGFFLLGSAVSKLGKGRKLSATGKHKRRGVRGVVQVAANGLPALAFAVLAQAANRPEWLPAALGCLAGALADTFSSEIGMMSRAMPVSILTLRPVGRGMSGGVTALGCLGGLLGAAVVAVTAIVPFGLRAGIAVFAAGLLGTLADSVLGAAAQVKYRTPGGAMTERPEQDGEALPVARGVRWLDNDMVNFLSGLVCGAICRVLL